MGLSAQELDSGVTVVALSGRLDTAWVTELEPSFNALIGSKRAIVVDLSSVNVLGSLGMRMLVHSGTGIIKTGGKFVILSPDPNITRVLKVAAIDSFIPIVSERASALAAVAT
jgi:anti-sigma B factor antagonist